MKDGRAEKLLSEACASLIMSNYNKKEREEMFDDNYENWLHLEIAHHISDLGSEHTLVGRTWDLLEEDNKKSILGYLKGVENVRKHFKVSS